MWNSPAIWYFASWEPVKFWDSKGHAAMEVAHNSKKWLMNNFVKPEHQQKVNLPWALDGSNKRTNGLNGSHVQSRDPHFQGQSKADYQSTANAWQHWSEQTSSLQPHDIIDNNQVWTQTVTPSEESFHRCRAIKSSYYTLLMDGNTHQVNFKNVERRYKELKYHTGVMAMLIGNKSDLLQIRAVFVEDGSHLPREKASSSWKRLNWTQQKWRTHSHRC